MTIQFIPSTFYSVDQSRSSRDGVFVSDNPIGDFARSGGIGSFHPLGNSLSYGGSQFCQPQYRLFRSVFHDRIISLDDLNLTVTVQSGVTIGKLNEFLFRQGFRLITTPGSYDATVGGCIASNVFGANFREPGFDSTVINIRVVGYDGQIRLFKANSDDHGFNMTLGGFGCTGFILETTLRIAKLKSKWIHCETVIGDFSSEFLEFLLFDSQLDGVDYFNAFVSFGSCLGHRHNRLVCQLARLDLGTDEQLFTPIGSYYLSEVRRNIHNYRFSLSQGFISLGATFFSKLIPYLVVNKESLSLADYLYRLSSNSLLFGYSGQHGFSEFQFFADSSKLASIFEAIVRFRELGLQMLFFNLKVASRINQNNRGPVFLVSLNFPNNARNIRHKSNVISMLLDKGVEFRLCKSFSDDMRREPVTFPHCSSVNPVFSSLAYSNA